MATVVFSSPVLTLFPDWFVPILNLAGCIALDGQLLPLLSLKVLSGRVFLVTEVTLSFLEKKAACREGVLLIHQRSFFHTFKVRAAAHAGV